MQAFATLLDRLVLTPAPQRQAPAARRLFSRRARSRPRLCARRAHRRSVDRQRQAGDAARPRRRAHGRGAVRLFLRLCRRPGRDDRAGLAGAARAPPRCRASPRWSRRCTPPRGSEGPRLVERWLDALDASGRCALLKLVTGGLRVGVTARLAKQALAPLRRQGRDRDRGDLARPEAALRRPLRLAGGAGASGRSAPRSRRSARSCWRTRSTRRSSPSSTRTTTPPNGSGTASACRRSSEEGVRKLYSRTGDDISGAFPDILDILDFEGAHRRRAAGRRARRRARSPSRPSATCSSG